MSHLKNPEKVEGGQRKIWVSEDEVKDILYKILKELKKLNDNVAILTDNEIKDSEIN